MVAGRWAHLVAFVAMPTTLLFAACGEPDHDVSATDADVPGELVVARDTDDDNRGELFIVAADGSEARAISDAEGFYAVVVSPDGTTAAAVQSADNSQPIVVVDLATGAVSPVSVPAGAYYGPSWSPSSEVFAFTGTDYGRFSTPTSSNSPGVIRDMIYIADAGGADALPVADSEGATAPAWSFDSTRLAFARDAAVWVMNPDGADARAITQGMQTVFWPAWSPVDDQIAFTGYEREFSAVYLVNADGSGQVKLSPDGVIGTNPAWSPDGRWIAFIAYDLNSGDTALHVIRPDGSDHRSIGLSKPANQLSWSPDGQWIAFTTVNAESDGPITSIHLSVINPFDEDPEFHTLVRDLTDQSAPAWRAHPE
jgi:Tol biopolymer transport system component